MSKKFFTGIATVAMLLVMAVAAQAATIYLKGSGSSFDAKGWTNTFDMAKYFEDVEYPVGSTPNVWHLVYTGKALEPDKKTGTVSKEGQEMEMQLTFTNGKVFKWDYSMKPSVNSGGNNPGWVIVAPYDWEIKYVNSGNNNTSESYVVSNEGGNNNFNISGFSKGTRMTVKDQFFKKFLQKTEDGTEEIEGPYSDFTFTIEGASGNVIAKNLSADSTGKVALNLQDLADGDYYIFEDEETWRTDPLTWEPWQDFLGFTITKGRIASFFTEDADGVRTTNPTGIFWNCMTGGGAGDEPEGQLTLVKMIDGVFANVALKGYNNPTEILNGITFYAYATDQYGNYGENSWYTIGKIDLETGMIVFENDLTAGWYVIVEDFSDLARSVFEIPAPLYVYVRITSEGAEAVAQFDYEAKYTIVNGWGWSGSRTLGYGTGNEYLNNRGDLFYIGVTNTNTGEEYQSFCAHGGSKAFAGQYLDCFGYMVPADDFYQDYFVIDGQTFVKDDFRKAFQYYSDVYADTFGDLSVVDERPRSSGRAIMQTVVWALLEAIEVESELFDATLLSDGEKAAVRDVMASYKDYVSNANCQIVDVILLTCENPLHNFEYCQPQIVPIYATSSTKIKFENVTRPPVTVMGMASFTKTVYGSLDYFTLFGSEFEFDLYKYNETTNKYDIFIGTYVAEDGLVWAKNLDSGYYVFREVPGFAYTITGNDGMWGYVWGAEYPGIWKMIFPGDDDGLYFEITNDYKTVWQYWDGEGNPVVDNKLFSKHTAFWTEGWYYGTDVAERIQLADGSYINIFNVGNLYAPEGYSYLELIKVDADCYNPNRWYFTSEKDPYGGLSFTTGEALGHNYEYNCPAGDGSGDWYTCTRCGTHELRPY